MIKILPIAVIVTIIILILGGLGYFRFIASKPSLTTSQSTQNTPQDSPIEVPKKLPQATLDDRVRTLEDVLAKLVTQVNNLKPATSQSSTSSDSRLANLESAVTELKVRVSALEKATPVSATSSKSTVYIPLGGGGGPWGDQNWNTLAEYQVSINPDNYPGYSNMQLEANFRLAEAAGTGSVRLYNMTDGSSVSPQIDTTSTSFGVQTSGTFKLPSGQKTYTIQVQTTKGKSLFVQNARIKVNF